MKDKIKKIVVGIRYRRSFRIPSIVGYIVDQILHDNDSPFGLNFFDEVGEMGSRGQILIGKNNNTLSVDFDSIILTLSTDNLDNTLNQIKNTYYPYMAKLLKNNNIYNFNRIGVMFDHQVEELKIINEIVGNLSSSKITSPDNLQLRFSKKLPDVMSDIKKNLVDYYNAIFIYQKNSDGLNVKLDYQVYFHPEIANIADVEFDNFIKSSIEYLTNNFYKWNNEKETN